MPLYTAFKCDRIVLDNKIVRGCVLVNEQGKIDKVSTDISEWESFPHITETIEVKDGVLMAGVVDSHVHVNSPGRSQWEDFPCATRAAAAGGVTTIADMPLNSIPSTTTLKNLYVKADVARGSVFVDVAFWGGVVPGNQNDLLNMISAGVVGFKCFLCPSGVDEFPCIDEVDLVKALEVLEKTNSLLAFHAECDLESDEIDLKSGVSYLDPEEYETYLSSRPPEMELKAIKLVLKMAEKYKARYHIVHVSAASGAAVVAEGRRRGVRITAETCPHYLTLASGSIPRGASQYKCAPPVRSSTNQEELWECLRRGDLDMIVSDHSPCCPELKTRSFIEAWGGISSLQFGLSLVWTHAVKRGLGLEKVSQLMSAAPAQLCGLQHRKGALRHGLDADLIVFDPEHSFTVTQEDIQHKNKLTPYLGMELKGKVLRTYLRGQLIYDEGNFSEAPLGTLLLKDG